MTSHLDVVFLDVGGPIYGDRPYYEALWRAVAEARPDAVEAEFWAEFEAARVGQNGSFTRRLILRFVGSQGYDAVDRRAHELWEYPPASLQPDAVAALERLHGRYRLGVLANQERWIRDTMARDGIDRFFDIWVVSAEVGADKPDPRIFEAGLRLAGVPPERCAMVGDRLDNDVVPARAQGMRAIWLLRGEAPAEPSDDQLRHADAAIRTLSELPEALERLGGEAG